MTFENKQYSINDLAPLISDCINSGKTVKMRVTGNSMFPLFRDRKDVVELAQFDKLRKYDIVLHKRNNGKYIMHRIIKKKGDVLTIAGDFEVEKEYPVRENQVLARVKGFYRNEKYYSCKGLFFRLYSIFWVAVFPHRLRILAVLLAVRRKFNAKK